MTKKQAETIIEELRFRAEFYRERSANARNQEMALMDMAKEAAYLSAISVVKKEMKIEFVRRYA
jgi:tRNA(Glu) U13 pseudouridine synthase TruD